MRRPTLADPTARDVLVAAALLVLGLLEAAFADPAVSDRRLQALLAVGYTVPLAVRRRWPVPVFLVAMVCGPLVVEVNSQGGLLSYLFAGVLAAFTLGRCTDPPATWWGPAVVLGVEQVLLLSRRSPLSDHLFIALIYGGAWLAGFVVRAPERRVEALQEEAAALRAAQEQRAERAVAAERARIARELHDVVSHGISVITIQVQAVRRRLDGTDGRDERNVRDLETVEATARQAMTEMRALLGVLRAGDDSAAELAPQPGTAQLEQLAEQTRASGLAVSLTVEGRPGTLPAGLDLALYRIVQEALTNVRKHSRATSADVLLTWTDDAVAVRVVDPGPSSGEAVPGEGRGRAGMRERAALYGGTLESGPADGGYRVHACFPRPVVRS